MDRLPGCAAPIMMLGQSQIQQEWDSSFHVSVHVQKIASSSTVEPIALFGFKLPLNLIIITIVVEVQRQMNSNKVCSCYQRDSQLILGREQLVALNKSFASFRLLVVLH